MYALPANNTYHYFWSIFANSIRGRICSWFGEPAHELLSYILCLSSGPHFIVALFILWLWTFRYYFSSLRTIIFVFVFFFFSYKSHEHFRYPKQKKNTIHFLFVLLNSSHCNTILDLSIYICVCVLHCSNGLVCVFIFFFTCCATLFCEFLCCFRHMIFFTLFICPVRVHVPLM